MSATTIDIDTERDMDQQLREQRHKVEDVVASAVGSPQLSLAVGGPLPTDATLKVSGKLGVARELGKGAVVNVQLSDDDGEVVAEGRGYVAQVAFKDHEPTSTRPGYTERAHTVKL